MSFKRQPQSHATPASSSGGPATASASTGGGGGSNAQRQEQLGLNGGDTTPTSEVESGEKPKNAQVILSARKGGSPFSKEFWTELNVGHCWVEVVTPEGRKDSWGYTAKSPRNFPRYTPWKSVPGMVLHPDRSRGASGTLVRDIDEDQLKKGEDWGRSAGDVYNLFGFDGGHSCASFAKGFFEAATGEKAPTSMFGALIASPNDLSAKMNQQVEKERQQNPEAVTQEEDQTTD
jgi:hypothetical protein